MAGYLDHIFNLIKMIDPTNATKVNDFDVLTALVFSLDSVTIGGAEYGVQIYNIWDDLLTWIQIARDKVVSTKMNNPSNDSYSIRELGSRWPGIYTQFNSTLGAMLKLVQGYHQSDPSVFLSFTNRGYFSLPYSFAPLVSASNDQQSQPPLMLALGTFLITSALAQNGWSALLLCNVDWTQLAFGPSNCPGWANPACSTTYHDDCPLLDTTAQCTDSYWWYSSK